MALFRYHIALLLILFVTSQGAFAQENVDMESEQDVEMEEKSSAPLNETNVKNSMILDMLELRDMDINDALKLISSKTGLNIISGRNVQGRVTIYLKNVDVYDALHIILDTNDLAFVEGRGIIQVMPAGDFERMYGVKFGQVTQRAIIPLQGMKVSEALILLNQMKSTLGKVVVDEQSNTLIIEDVPDKIKSMKEFIKVIDLPVSTKMFELKYAQADLLTVRISEILTPKLGEVRVDGPTNKIFVKDTLQKLKEIEILVQQLDFPRTTKVVELSYAKAEDLLKTISPMITKDIGHVEMDIRTNKLVITDIMPKVTEMLKVINALDHQDKEVLIEARIVQVTLNERSKMGLDLQGIINKWHNLQITSKFSQGLTNPTSEIKIGTLDADEYNAVLQAINTAGKARVLSNPSIAVVNNHEAKILVGTTRPYVTTTTTTPSSGAPIISESVTLIDVGVKLTVTPTIHEDGYITIKVKPEVSSATEKIITSTNNEIPIVDTSTVETTVRVKDGVTIVLGGLIKDERTSIKNKVPLLGSIPILGRAFSNEDEYLEKKEIIIFLTPHIITGDVQSEDLNPALLKEDKVYTDIPLK